MKRRIELIVLRPADGPTREILDRIPGSMRTPNLLRTVANHPPLLHPCLELGAYLLRSSTHEPRLRELVVLRTGWQCRSPYEWGQHVVIGRMVDVLDADPQRLTQGAEAAGWTTAEAAALRSTDELVELHSPGDTAWAKLTAHFWTRQILDLIFPARTPGTDTHGVAAQHD